MSQPTASVDIANLALDRLGQDPIVNLLNPDSPPADICARWYDQTRRQLLRKFVFNFARKTVLLSPNTSAPSHPEFLNGYSMPNDFIRLLTLGDRIMYGGQVPTQFYDFSAGYLYCDELTNQGTGVVTPQPTLTITAIYRSGETISGVTVPLGQTVIVVSGGTPIPGAQYLLSTIVGTTQANGNTYQIVAGTLSLLSVYFLQTTAGQNFDSSSWSVYISGGTAAPTFVPPGAVSNPTGLEFGYVFDAVNVHQFDPAFIDVLRLQLAANMARKFTLKKSDVSDILEELKDANLVAAAVAGQEKPPRRIQRSRIKDVRRAGGIFRNNSTIGGPGTSLF